MTAYQLKDIPDRFMGTETDVMSLAEQLGDENLVEMLMLQPSSNESLQPIWRDVVVDSWCPLSPTSTERPDISLWEAGCLLLNQKAYTALKAALTGHGEFLPITVDGEPMHVFNCLTFAQEDMGLTERNYTDGYEDGLLSLVFDEEDISNKMVFKSRLEGPGILYVSKAFKALVDQSELQGLRFDEDLLDPF